MTTTTTPEFAVVRTVDADRIDRGDASHVAHVLETEVAVHRHEVTLVVGHERLAVTADVSQMLLSTYRLLAAGQDVIVGTVPAAAQAQEETEAEVTTAQAAKLLGVSRPHVIELIRRRILPARTKSTMPGSHRRLRRSDVLAYRQRLLTSATTSAALEQAADEIDLDEVYGADTPRTR